MADNRLRVIQPRTNDVRWNWETLKSGFQIKNYLTSLENEHIMMYTLLLGCWLLGKTTKKQINTFFHGYPEKRVTDLFLSFFLWLLGSGEFSFPHFLVLLSLSTSCGPPVSHEAPSHFSAAPQALMALVTAMRPGARGPPRRSRKRKRCRARCHSLKRIKKVGIYFATVVKTMEVTTMPRLPIDK